MVEFRDGSMKRDGTYTRGGNAIKRKEKIEDQTPLVWGIPEHGLIAAEKGNLLICNSCQTPVLTVVKTLHKSEIGKQISPTFFKYMDGKDVQPMFPIQCPKCFLTSSENKQFSSLCIIKKGNLEAYENKFATVSVLQIIAHMFTGILKEQLKMRKEIGMAKRELLKRIEIAPENIVKNSRKLEEKSHKDIISGLFIQLNQKSKTVSQFFIHNYEEQDILQEHWTEYKRRFCHAISQKLLRGDITQRQLPKIIQTETGDRNLGQMIIDIVKKEMEKSQEKKETDDSSDQ